MDPIYIKKIFSQLLASLSYLSQCNKSNNGTKKYTSTGTFDICWQNIKKVEIQKQNISEIEYKCFMKKKKGLDWHG